MRTTTRSLLAGAMGALLVTVLLGATNQFVSRSTSVAVRNDGIQFPDGSVQTSAAGGESRALYYLDVGSGGYDGAATTTACDAGFHFASIFEIVDPSNLRYDTTRGMTTADSGGGPPQTIQGWVRTGDISSSQADVGFANCGDDLSSPWSSNQSDDRGTYAWFEDPLGADWNSPASRIAPWSAGTAPCNIPFGVWCVEDYAGAGSV